jgi:hypothetical protein
MTHPLVDQLRFTRREFRRGLAGLSEEDARRRIGPANPIAWNVGHLAWQEQRYWLQRLGGASLVRELDQLFCYGCPPHTPTLAEAWGWWEAVVTAAEPALDSLTTDDHFLMEPSVDGVPVGTTTGSMMHRVIYHYWYHLGESLGLRQAMGHTDLAEFVGNIDQEAPFRPVG